MELHACRLIYRVCGILRARTMESNHHHPETAPSKLENCFTRILTDARCIGFLGPTRRGWRLIKAEAQSLDQLGNIFSQRLFLARVIQHPLLRAFCNPLAFSDFFRVLLFREFFTTSHEKNFAGRRRSSRLQVPSS